MPLFRYVITVPGGARKTGQITAKNEAAARENVSSQREVVEWISIKAANPPPQPGKKPVEAKESVLPKPALGKLQKLLFLQHGNCFFCGNPLAETDASIEHLHPVSRGGGRIEENEVVCHKSLNAAFGDLDLKRKFAYVLKNAGKFRCP